jgi:SAM-dependent methyltransferase
MALWLAEQVGPSGEVVATDIDVTYLQRLEVPNLEVVEHNILDSPLEPLEPGSFDLVCMRFVLAHLSGRQEAALKRIVQCLRPGGWLIDEDGDWGTTAPVDPCHHLHAAFHAAWREGHW